MQAILYLIKSRNPPVFKTPLVIVYSVEPTVGQPFLFGNANLSMVQKITKIDGYQVIETLNSTYNLYPLPEVL